MKGKLAASVLNRIGEGNLSKVISLIGLAKNAGKTIAFNQLVSELAGAGRQLGLLSFGRDGEKIDAVTNKEKPRILVPPGAFFVTAESAAEHLNKTCRVVKDTGIQTMLGNVKIYQNNSVRSRQVELVGINRTSTLKKIRTYLEGEVEFLIVDGALDRRSSALPGISAGIILSTGAVLGADIDSVVKKTDTALTRLLLPELEDERTKQTCFNLIQRAADSRRGGWLLRPEYEAESRNSVRVEVSFQRGSSLGLAKELDQFLTERGPIRGEDDLLLLSGALTDSLAKQLLRREELRGLNIVVQDGTRVFLQRRYLQLLFKNNVKLKVLDEIKVAALTVNPHNPEGRDLDSASLQATLKKLWSEIPIYDVLAADYQEIKK